MRDFIGDSFPVNLNGRRVLLRPDQVIPCPNGKFTGWLVTREFLGVSVKWVIAYQGQTLCAVLPSRDEGEVSRDAQVRFDIAEELF